MGGKRLQQVYSTKFLGVHIDHRLTWRDHISAICSKVARNTGILAKVKHFLPSYILKILYQTLVLPHISYCSNIWSGTRDSNLSRLVILQKRAIRHLSHAAFRDHTGPLFRNLNLLKVNDIIRLNLATFAYKAWNGFLPNAFKNYIVSNRNIHNHNTRSARDAHYYKNHTTVGMLSVQTRTIHVWNSLPDHIQNKPSRSSLRCNLFEDIIASY